MKKFVRVSVLSLVALAVLGIGGLTVFQRSLLYRPHTEVIAPTQTGVTAERIKTIDGQSLVAWYLPAPKGAPMFLSSTAMAAGRSIGPRAGKRLPMAAPASSPSITAAIRARPGIRRKPASMRTRATATIG